VKHSLAVVADADCCIPFHLCSLNNVYLAPIDPPLLIEPDTIPQLHSEATAVPVKESIAAVRKAIEDGATELLYLATGDGFGSPDNLHEAFDQIENRVTIESSDHALMGSGWQAVVAAEVIRAGGTLNEAISTARAVRKEIHVLVMLEHPELTSAAGNAEFRESTHRALVSLRGTEVSIISRPKTREEALTLLRDDFAKRIVDSARARIAVHHAGAEAGAEALAIWIQRKLPNAELVIAPLTRHAAARLGPRMLGIAWYEIPPNDYFSIKSRERSSVR
tara:strand:+ start:302 stop:1135 length:834 start_codon:yes stop_codon:yes gene_type:complete